LWANLTFMVRAERGASSTVTPNGQLRAARQRSTSTSSPGLCLSRQELAEQINAYVWDHYQKRTELDGNYLGKLERGVVRWPGKMYREALREILKVSTDAQLGFHDKHRTVISQEMVDVARKLDRRTAVLSLGTLGMGGLASVAALLEDGEPTQIPAKIGATEIAKVRSATGVFESWGYTDGGGLVREAVSAQLRWSAGLLQATCPEQLRPALFSAVGELAEITGWMAFDACAHDEARRKLHFALSCAEKADNWLLRAGVLGDLAIQAIWTGRPDEGLTLAEHALVRADRLPPVAQAPLHIKRARALGKMDRVQDTLHAVGTADDHFAHADPANDPQYWAHYNAAYHGGTAGAALADLAIHGHHDPAQATDRLTSAISGQEHVAYRAQDLITLATLTMVTGDPVEAAALGTAALESAATSGVRSQRATEDLRQLDHHAARHTDVGEVAEFRRHINHAFLT